MAPSRNTVLALLGLVTSIQAIPAALPEAQFGIGPPHYSISWGAPLPVVTDDPEYPEEPEYPAPTPSDQISLSPPSATISWDGPSVPTEDPEPEDPEDPEDPEEPEEPEEPLPSPTDIISLNPPTYSISWDGPQPPKTTRKPWPQWPPRTSHQISTKKTLTKKTSTKKTSTKGYVSATFSWAQKDSQTQPGDVMSLNPPSYSDSWDGPTPPKTTKRPWPPKPTKKPWPPRPTAKTSTNGYVSASVSWGKRDDGPSYSISWDPQPPATTRKPWPWWPPARTSTNGYVSASVSWGKRQEGDDPEPTDFPSFPSDPEEPEDPDSPISFPAGPLPTPSDVISIQPPQVSFSWGKRQEEEPGPTDLPEPEDPEDPEDPDSPIGFPGSPAPTPPNSIGIQPPRVSFSWGKREAAASAPFYGLDKPTASIKPPGPSKPSRLPKTPKTTTKAWISWGKRQEDDGPTEVFPPAPTPSDQITFVPPTASLSWGKRDDDKKHPTTLVTHKTRPTLTVTDYIPTSSACPTVTKTIVSPCVPPTCPHNLVSCMVSEAQEVEVREIEKTIVTITTVAKPSVKPTPTKSVCTTSTVVVNVGCPTYTCVPWDNCN
ncbi:hypothetical protein PMIN03_002807 [Paraphaeosphaeria minitans]